MIKFLADENFPIASIRFLRRAGYTVVAVIEDSPAESDENILAFARANDLVILTFDRDYGDLIYRLHLPAPMGVIYLRYDPFTPEEPGQHILQLL